VVLAIRNEEKNIRECLEHLEWADEVIVVDDMSTDNSVKICREYTQKIISHDCKDSISDNRNLGIKESSGDWILQLDADEVITPELAQEMRQAVNDARYIAYRIPRKNYFLGKWIRGCGWYPDANIRLFKKGAAWWPPEIHDVLHIREEEKVGNLKNAMIHYSYRSLQQYFEKFNRYTTRLAQEEYEKGHRVNSVNFFLCFILKPLYWVLRKYFLQAGFRDGFWGFFISCSSGLVIFFTHAKLWEMQKNEKR
jgi:glycosyltransferase involved in cell wall biosynthesis